MISSEKHVLKLLPLKASHPKHRATFLCILHRFFLLQLHEDPYIADELSTTSIPFPHFPSSDSKPDHQLMPMSQESFSETPIDVPQASPEEEDEAEFIIPEHFY